MTLSVFDILDILALHDAALARWSADVASGLVPLSADVPPGLARQSAPAPDLAGLLETAHFANFTIWGLEDEARRRDVGDARIAALKRAIDPWNQRRNDLMEAIDAAVLQRFANVNVASAELHSETAGMIVDRLSILALKIRNMDRVAEEAAGDGDAALVEECARRAAVLREQRRDLAGCLERLLDDFAAGRRHFKTWRQLKSYNDDRLNPALRAAAGRGGPREEN